MSNQNRVTGGDLLERSVINVGTGAALIGAMCWVAPFHSVDNLWATWILAGLAYLTVGTGIQLVRTWIAFFRS